MPASPRRKELLQAKKQDESDDLRRLPAAEEHGSPASEAYRTLRTNLIYSFVDNPPKVIVLTSAGPQEGKSTTCANLGVVLAQAGKNTLILDCDFRKPVIHKYFGLRNLEGVVDVLARYRELRDVAHEPVPGLKVVPVGPIPPNPAELMGTRRLSELLAKVRAEFDYVLVDAPPVGLVSDPAILATQGDGVLFVVDAQKSRKGAVRRSLQSLRTVGNNILGTVMNNVKVTKGDYDGYGYYDSSYYGSSYK